MMVVEKDVRIFSKEKNVRRERFPYIACVEILVSLAVPVAITVYTIVQDKCQLDIARESRLQDVELANRTHMNDLYIATEQLQDSVLNGYLDYLTDTLEKY